MVIEAWHGMSEYLCRSKLKRISGKFESHVGACVRFVRGRKLCNVAVREYRCHIHLVRWEGGVGFCEFTFIGTDSRTGVLSLRLH